MSGQTRIPRQLLRATAAVLVWVLLVPAAGLGDKSLRKRAQEIHEPYRTWLEEVALLMTKEELASFLELDQDYQRDAFIERFWRARDPYPETARNEFKQKWDARVEEVRATIGDFSDERAEMMLLNGYPDALIPISCMEVWPGEVWYYRRPETSGQEIAVYFYQPGGLGRFRIWYPTEGISTLLRFPDPQAGGANQLDQLIGSCSMEESDALLAALRLARALGIMGFQTSIAAMKDKPEAPSGEWVATFSSYSTDLPEGAASFDADLSFDFPGRYKSRTVVQGMVSVAPDKVGLASMAGHESYNLLLTGEVLREGKLFDNFRYSYNIPAVQAAGGKLPLIFERYLRPGDYDLILKIEDLNSGAFYRELTALSVPRADAVVRTEPQDPETARILAEANAAISSGDNSVKIVPPRGDLQTGLLRVDTLTTGDEITEVRFSLDGSPPIIKRRPPFSVELDLGSLPRMRLLVAAAYDAEGNELARDERPLNSGSHRFAVRLIEPRKGKRYERSLRAEAEVDVPDGETLERVEFYLNETLVAALYQPPWVQPVVLPAAEQVAYVRAVAYQPDGNSTEELVFVNAPEYLEEVDVQFVELYVAVLDRDKRPVEGLELSDFTISEDGVEQTPVRFDVVSDLPIHAGILLDVSASMAEEAPAACPEEALPEPGPTPATARRAGECTRVAAAKAAALGFFEQAITPKDRATLITFNDHPNLAAKFTSEIDGLAGGLAGLKAERGTALYDSVVFSLYYFNGIKGQRALILLSDGRDEHSRFTFEDTLEYARRAGVAIYAIGLNLKGKHGEAKRKLTKLAAETGGRAFLIDDARELPGIYDSIQKELRSRYYIAYQSSNTSDSKQFRSIEVELAEKRLEAKTLRGYYP